MGNVARQRAWTYQGQPRAKLLLLALADFIPDGGASCWPAVPTLAALAGVSDRQAQRLIDQLAAEGVIAVERGRGRNHTNMYTLLIAPTDADGKGAISSDRGDIAMSPLPEPEKVTCDDGKGDIFSDKGDIAMSIKGDIAMSPEPKENRSNRKKKREERAAHAPRPLKQTSLNRLHDVCIVVERAFGKKLTPAAADLIVSWGIDDIPKWERNVAAYASRYDRINTDGLKDWYLGDKAARNGAANGAHRPDRLAGHQALGGRALRRREPGSADIPPERDAEYRRQLAEWGAELPDLP